MDVVSPRGTALPASNRARMHADAKPTVVILHGANGAASLMKPLADELRGCAEAFMPNMLGHGGREVPESLTIESLAADVVAQMDAAGLPRAYLFGFSSGGLVALYLARHFPERFHGVCTVAAKYVFDQKTVEHWTYMISFERLERPGGKRPQELARDHAPQDWKKVISMNRDMFVEFGKKPPLDELDLRAISIPALLFSSNQDQIVTLDETLALSRLIPNSKPVIFQGQCHPFNVVPVPAVAKAMCNWIAENERRGMLAVTPRPSIVILHGSNGSGATMRALADAVQTEVNAYTPNMLAHGGRDVPERVTIEDLANDIIAYMDGQHLAHAYVFGYSSGACLALYLARHFPQRFDGVCTLAAKYVFDEKTVAHWTHLTDPERLGRPGNKRAAELTETHAPQDWVAVTSSNRRLFEDYGRNPPLSEDDLRAIKIPALLFSSDNDQLVPLAETTALGEFIADSRVVIFKGQAHPFSLVPIPAMGNVITKWIAQIEARGALDRELSAVSWTLRPPLVVLHGANGSGASMQPLTDQLEAHTEIFAPDLIGQGGRPLPERLTIEEMASDVIAQMDARGIRQTYLFGYSSGGYLALYLARHYPERFIAVSALAVKYVFDARTVAHWTHLADPKRIRELNAQTGRMDELIR
ncbi:MAG TPA: alpha/beta hydrolase, partial [Candidatus Baltobacteraceae bacterium]|nr:alpha/beta hydrolase [Candidatus Baltobacteraceae bacterium]